MTFPEVRSYKFKTADHSIPEVDFHEEHLTVSILNGRIIFKKYMEYVRPESISGLGVTENIEISPIEALKECKKDPKCNAFVESLFKHGFKLEVEWPS